MQDDKQNQPTQNAQVEPVPTTPPAPVEQTRKLQMKNKILIAILCLFSIIAFPIKTNAETAQTTTPTQDIKFGKIGIQRNSEEQCSDAMVPGQLFTFLAKDFSKNPKDVVTVRYNGEDHKFNPNTNGEIFGEITVPENWTQNYFGIQAIGNTENGDQQISNGLIAITNREECQNANSKAIQPESISVWSGSNYETSILMKNKIGVGQTTPIFTEFTPENTTNKHRIYESLNPEIAIIFNEDYGVIEGISEGEATIKVTTLNGKVSAYFTIKVVSEAEYNKILENPSGKTDAEKFQTRLIETILPLTIMISFLVLAISLPIIIIVKARKRKKQNMVAQNNATVINNENNSQNINNQQSQQQSPEDIQK